MKTVQIRPGQRRRDVTGEFDVVEQVGGVWFIARDSFDSFGTVISEVRGQPGLFRIGKSWDDARTHQIVNVSDVGKPDIPLVTTVQLRDTELLIDVLPPDEKAPLPELEELAREIFVHHYLDLPSASGAFDIAQAFIDECERRRDPKRRDPKRREK